MGHRPDFDDDVFISYAHIDDAPLTPGQKGWVQQFHWALQIRLQQLLGRELSVWRDDKLQGNDYFDPALLHRLSRIAVLVSILSPRYLHSEWCLKELREFVTVAERTRGLRIGDRARIFKVVKTFVARDEHPPELQGLLGYEFYQMDPAGRPREFLRDLGEDASRNYWAKLEDLAYDIHELLKALRTPAADSPRIYLAETTSTLDPQRLSIWRELRQRGYRVLPDRPLPLEAVALRAAVREQLDQAQLSIHLVGPSYGVVPDGESRSVVSIQLDLAVEGPAPLPRPRLVWLPPELTPSDERQRAFVAALRDDYAGRPGLELLESSLEDFKTFVQDRLIRPSVRRPPPSVSRPRRVYVMCDARDLQMLRPIEDHLYQAGFEVTLPARDGDVSQLREDHQANLVDSDAVLVFWGQGSDLWVRSMLRDLAKAGAYGRTGPFLAAAVYVADPATAAKEDYRSHEVTVLRGFGAFEATRLADFVAALEAASSASP